MTSSVPYYSTHPDPTCIKYNIWPSNLKKTFDAQVWDKGTMAITGYGRQWKLEHFTKASVSDTIVTQPTATDAASVLMDAARAGDIPQLNQLIAQGNNINIQNKDGLTPLSRAIGGKQSETALWLIRHGADINLASHDGGTPLVWAAWRDLPSVVTELLVRNADPNASFNNGQTALMLAASNGNLELVKKLIEKGARTTSIDNDGQNVFVWSAHTSKPDVLIYFLQNKPDQQSLNKALFCAVQSSQSNNITLLIKHGADLKSRASCGCSLINRAAQYSEPEIVQYLANEGADLNFPDCNGAPPVIRAAIGGLNSEERPDNAGMLLRAGADFFKTGQAGRTVYDYSDRRLEVRAFIFEAVGKYVLRTFDDQDTPFFNASP